MAHERFFFLLLDATALSTFVLKSPQIMEKDCKRTRRLHLEKLGKALCKMQIENMVKKWVDSKFVGISQDLQQIAKKKEGFLVPENAPNAPNVQRLSARCCMCPRSDDRKNRSYCGTCMRHVCKGHSAGRLVICLSCKNGQG